MFGHHIVFNWKWCSLRLRWCRRGRDFLNVVVLLRTVRSVFRAFDQWTTDFSDYLVSVCDNKWNFPLVLSVMTNGNKKNIFKTNTVHSYNPLCISAIHLMVVFNVTCSHCVIRSSRLVSCDNTLPAGTLRWHNEAEFGSVQSGSMICGCYESFGS